MRKLCKDCLHFDHCVNIPNYPVTENTVGCDDWESKDKCVPVVRCKDCHEKLEGLNQKERKEQLWQKVIAVDFDGTLCVNRYPEIGEPQWGVIIAAIEEMRRGAKLILWTCRTGKKLGEAVAAAEKWGLTFDAVNENLPERIKMFGNDSRKIGADEYWDDRAVALDEIPGIGFSERFRNKLLYGVACTDAELEVMTREYP